MSALRPFTSTRVVICPTAPPSIALHLRLAFHSRYFGLGVFVRILRRFIAQIPDLQPPFKKIGWVLTMSLEACPHLVLPLLMDRLSADRADFEVRILKVWSAEGA